MAVDDERLRPGRHDLYSRTDARPIALLADQLDSQPIVPLARVLEQDIVIFISIGNTSHLDEDVEVAVAVPVGERDSMPFLKVAGTRRCRDFGKSLAVHALEQSVRHQ